MSEQMASITLKRGKEKPILNRHPWIYSGAVARVDGQPAPGDLVDVRSAQGQWLARGYFNRKSQIIVRLLTWQADEAIDETFWRSRLERALAGRQALAADDGTTAYRLVNAENDGLPGLMVDRYAGWLVVQVLTLGMERFKSAWLPLLQAYLSPDGIYERSDVDVRGREGLASQAGLLSGDAPPARLWVREHGHEFAVDLAGGHKTGFYLDQRENRRRTALAIGTLPAARVLNCFSYSGAFAVYALAAGAAHVSNVDSSYEALVLAEENLVRNGFDPERQAQGLAGDVFQVLRDLRGRGEQFDAVILDPPKFAHSRGQVQAATRGYKDINLLALHLLRPGGLLATFSCSGLVSSDLFQKVVFGAGVDAGRDLQLVERLGHGLDHPILLSVPEGEYLKGLLCRVW